MGIYCLVLSLFVCCAVSLVNAASLCDTNNGGCGQYCNDRGDGNGVECACGCYFQLGSDNQTCDPITQCDVDILYVIDASKGTDYDCAIGFLNGYGNYSIWRSALTSYLLTFDTELGTGEYKIAPAVVGKNLFFQNYNTHTTSVSLASYINSIGNNDICGSQSMYNFLYNTYAHPEIANSVIEGPTDPRPGENTTRVAIASIALPAMPSIAQIYIDSIRTYYDQVIVIGIIDTKNLQANEIASIVALYTPQLRALACPTDTTLNNCPFLYYTDGSNDFNATFSRSTVIPQIDRGACAARKTQITHSVSCSATQMIITIPKCLLGGLTRADLQLNTISCNGTTYATDTGTNLVFTIPYDQCSFSISSQIVGSKVVITMTQTVQTRTNFPANSNVFNVSLSGGCMIERSSSQFFGFFNPVVSSLNAAASANGTYTVATSLSLDNYASTASPPLSIQVASRVYFEAIGTTPGNTFLILQSVVASNSTSPSSSPNFGILNANCPSDTTFVFETSPNNRTTVRFSFLMFMFSVKNPDGSPMPVYIHLSFLICVSGDTSASCTQGCNSGRRKRELSAEEQTKTVTKVIGPIFFDEREPESVNERIIVKDDDHKTETEQINVHSYSRYYFPPNLQVALCWLLLIVAFLSIVVLLKHICVRVPNSNYIRFDAWRNQEVIGKEFPAFGPIKQ